MDKSLVVIAHNIRSSYNIGSLLRTCDGLGVEKVYLSGYTPYPLSVNEVRLPYLAAKAEKLIDKTALGAQNYIDWQKIAGTKQGLQMLTEEYRNKGYKILGLEQTASSKSLPDYEATKKTVLVLGNEVTGIEPDIIKLLDACLEIPMLGSKESFNVIEAASMALYHLRFSTP